MPPDALDLLSKMLDYVPHTRIDPITALCHPFFDELRQEGTKLDKGKDLPPLFNFTEQGFIFLILPLVIQMSHQNKYFFFSFRIINET